jgi:hypothetical protein
MPELVWYRTKLTQSAISLVRFRTKILDARMLIPALVTSMPMPSYEATTAVLAKNLLHLYNNEALEISVGHSAVQIAILKER